jgi:hypothetical protein
MKWWYWPIGILAWLVGLLIFGGSFDSTMPADQEGAGAGQANY